MSRRALLLTLVCALLTVSATTVAPHAHALHSGPPAGQRGVRKTVTLASGRQYDVQFAVPAGKPKPLILMLPGLNQTAAAFDASSDAYAFGRAHAIVIAYARALPAPGGITAWNAGYCCAKQSTDDVAYLRDIVNSVAAVTAIDRQRAYLIGMSNGGMMALAALCEAPEIFRAAVSVAGPFLGTHCARATWLHLAGVVDGIVPVHGGGEMWCGCILPPTTTEEKRFPGSTIRLVSGANHSWPRAADGSWNFDGMSVAWSYLKAQRS